MPLAPPPPPQPQLSLQRALRKQKKKLNDRLVRSTLAASAAKAEGNSSGSEEDMTVECVGRVRCVLCWNRVLVSLLSDAAHLFVPDACPAYLFLMFAAFVFFRVSSRAPALTAACLTLLLPLHHDTLFMPRTRSQPQRLTLCASYNLVCLT